MRFTFEIAGKVQFDRAFNRVGEHISDLRPVWPEAEKAFHKIEREQFASEGAKGMSGKWQPLSPAYAKQKTKAVGNKPILQRSGRLYRSLTGVTNDSVNIREKQEFGIGSRLFYAVFHQEGTGKMPAREPISFSEPQREDMHKAIQRGLLKILKSDKAITQSIEVE